MSKEINKELSFVSGINGCYHLLISKKFKIYQIDLMVDGPAVNNKKIKNLFTNKYTYSNMPKKQFLNKYKNLRTQGVVIYFYWTLFKTNINSINQDCYILLDRVEDPQNLGQILRTCDGAGVQNVIIPSKNSCPITNTVLQVSQGAFTNVYVYKINDIINEIKRFKKNQYKVIAIENTKSKKAWHSVLLGEKILLIFGSEGFGVDKRILKYCDEVCSIPMQGVVNSINVSATVSAVLYERLRQLGS